MEAKPTQYAIIMEAKPTQYAIIMEAKPTHNLSDLKHDLHCGFVELVCTLGGSVSDSTVSS